MSDNFLSILPSIAVLGTACAVALYLAIRRGWAHDDRLFEGAILIAAAAVLAQGVHFIEELRTGFDVSFPAMFGLAPMPLGFFIWFNVGWLLIWAISVWGLSGRSRLALFPLWFLAIGCLLNGVAHPALALLSDGYFPGLITSPFVGVMGILLFRALLRVTRASEPVSQV